MAKISGVKTFTTETKLNIAQDNLGDKITEWIKNNPFITIEDKIVAQSDNYITAVFFYSGQGGGNPLT